MALIHALGNAGLLGASHHWGVVPRDLDQFWGFASFHLRHGSWSHWFANAVPLIFLSGLAHMMAPRATVRMWILLPLLSGLLLWTWGRPGAHIGASALTYGWFYFLLAMGILRRDRAAIAGMMVAMFLFGSMLWVFMAPSGVSWEGHVAGAVAGLLGGWIWRRLDPLPPPLLSDDDEGVDDAQAEDREDLSPFATHRPRNQDPWGG